jgi:outer membrane protein
MGYKIFCTGIAAGLLMATVAVPGVALAGDEWKLEVGGGVGYQSKYEGSDEMEVMFLPVLGITWKDTVYLSTEDGLGAVVYDNNDFTVNVSFNYEWGRDESDSSDLKGLGDVDGAATANLSLEYEAGPVTPFVELTRHLGGTNALEVSFGVETMIPVRVLMGRGSASSVTKSGDGGADGPAILAGISATWSDGKYMESYFGINSTQSARSGLSQFTAKSGLKSVGVDLGFLYPVNENWEILTMIEYSQLIGDAADSPISKDNSVLFGGVAISYKF